MTKAVNFIGSLAILLFWSSTPIRVQAWWVAYPSSSTTGFHNCRIVHSDAELRRVLHEFGTDDSFVTGHFPPATDWNKLELAVALQPQGEGGVGSSDLVGQQIGKNLSLNFLYSADRQPIVIVLSIQKGAETCNSFTSGGNSPATIQNVSEPVADGTGTPRSTVVYDVAPFTFRTAAKPEIRTAAARQGVPLDKGFTFNDDYGHKRVFDPSIEKLSTSAIK